MKKVAAMIATLLGLSGLLPPAQALQPPTFNPATSPALAPFLCDADFDDPFSEMSVQLITLRLLAQRTGQARSGYKGPAAQLKLFEAPTSLFEDSPGIFVTHASTYGQFNEIEVFFNGACDPLVGPWIVGTVLDSGGVPQVFGVACHPAPGTPNYFTLQSGLQEMKYTSAELGLDPDNTLQNLYVLIGGNPTDGTVFENIAAVKINEIAVPLYAPNFQTNNVFGFPVFCPDFPI